MQQPVVALRREAPAEGGKGGEPDGVCILIHRLRPEQDGDLPLPRYMSDQAAGLDVCAANREDIVLEPGRGALIPTGLAIALPAGFEVQVRPRSGLAVRHSVGLINAPGTIDADYRGEVKIALFNFGGEPFTVRRGERIAQLVMARAFRAELREVAELPQTARGSGGFGHTGT